MLGVEDWGFEVFVVVVIPEMFMSFDSVNLCMSGFYALSSQCNLDSNITGRSRLFAWRGATLKLRELRPALWDRISG